MSANSCHDCGKTWFLTFVDGMGFRCNYCIKGKTSKKICGFCGDEYKGFWTQRCPPCSDALYSFWKFACGRQIAQQSIQREIRGGRLLPAAQFKCADCHAPACDYDHRDYSKPINVQPVCRRCNLRRGHAIPKAWTFDEFMEWAHGRTLRIKNYDHLRKVFEQLTPKPLQEAA